MGKGRPACIAIALTVTALMLLSVACSEQSTPGSSGNDLIVGNTAERSSSERIIERVIDENSHAKVTFTSEVDFKSTITSIDSDAGTMTVQTRSETITVDAGTFIYRSDNISADDSRGGAIAGKVTPGDDDGERGHRQREAIPFSALMVGDTVEIHADVIDANTLYAVAIEQEDSVMDNEIEFTDIIISLDPVSRSVTFGMKMLSGIVADNADLRDTANVIVPLENFLLCGPVQVKGFMLNDTTLSVTRMKMEDSF